MLQAEGFLLMVVAFTGFRTHSFSQYVNVSEFSK